MTIFDKIMIRENSDADPTFLELEAGRNLQEVTLTLTDPDNMVIGRFFIEDLIAALEVMRAQRGIDIQVNHDPYIEDRYEEGDVPF